MRILKPLVLALFGLLASVGLAQIPAPQINLSGNIGCQGFPCLNNGTLVMASDANRSMTALETSAMFIKVTSSVSLTATRNLIAPAGRFNFTIENATTGGQSIQIIGPSGTGVTIANGTAVGVWNDGTNFVQIGSSSSGGGPNNFPAVTHQFLNAYDSGTNNLSAAQPDFTDLSGVATPAQLPTATGSTLGIVRPDGTSCTVTSGVLTCPGSGGYTPPTGTGFVHITSGAQDPAARAVDLSSADATGTLAAGREPAHTGDVTNSAGSLALILATVNGSPGACGDATHVCDITTNGKGLVTAQSATGITFPVTSVSGAAGNRAAGITPTTGAVVVTTFDQQLYASQFSTIPALVTACGSAATKITVDTAQSFTLAANATFPANCAFNFVQGGIWTTGGAFTLTFNGPVDLNPSPHFAGAATVAGLRGGVPAEAFGVAQPYTSVTAAAAGSDDTAKAALAIAAITQGGWVQFRCGYYHINTMAFTGSVNGAKGLCHGYSYPSASLTTVIVSNSATAPMVTFGNGSAQPTTVWNVLEDIAFQRSVHPTGSTSAGISVDNAGGMYWNNVKVEDSLPLLYLHMAPSYGFGMYRVSGDWGESVVAASAYAADTPKGFYIDSADGNEENSLNIVDSTVNCAPLLGTGAVTTGYLVTGSNISDVNVEGGSTAECSYGSRVTYTGGTSGLANNVRFDNFVADHSVISAALIENVRPEAFGTGGAVTFNGGEFDTADGASCNIDVENSLGINFTGKAQIVSSIPSCINNSSDIGFTGNQFNHLGISNSSALIFTTTINSSVTGNTFTAVSTAANTQDDIQFNSTSANNVVDGNSFSLGAGVGVFCDGTSNGNIIGANSFDTHIANNTSGCGSSTLYLQSSGKYGTPPGGTATIVAVNGTPTSIVSPANLKNSVTNATGLGIVLTNPTAGDVLHEITGNLLNSHLASQTANTVLGALTATTPSGLALPSCSSASNALTWTTGTGFGCNTISGGSMTWPTTPGIAVCTGTPCTAWGTSLTAPTSTIVGISDTQTLTNKNIDGAEINSGTLPAARLPAQYKVGSCTEAWGGSGTSHALSSGDDAVVNNTCYNDSGVTRTITAVKCRNDNASNTTTVNPTFGSAGTGTTILSGALTCGSSYAYSSSGTVTNASWTTGTGVDPVQGGTLTGTSVAIIVEYTF